MKKNHYIVWMAFIILSIASSWDHTEILREKNRILVAVKK